MRLSVTLSFIEHASTKQDNGHFQHFSTADEFKILQGVMGHTEEQPR